MTRATLLRSNSAAVDLSVINLVIAVPEKILKRAHRRAQEQGTSLDAVLREYLSQYASAQSPRTNAA